MLSNDLDETLWRARYNEFYPLLYRLLLSKTGCDEDMAKEYLSQVFETLVIKEYLEKVKINKGFAYGVALNVISQHRRNFAVRKRVVEEVFIPLTLLEREARTEENPESIHERNERAKMGRKVLSSLPPSVRLGWLLHRVEGMTIEDTAQVIERSLTTTKAYVHRGDAALELLRTTWEAKSTSSEKNINITFPK